MATSMTRRNPFGAVDPTWSRMWDWFTTPTGHTPMSKFFGEANPYVPPVDIYETREEIIVAAYLPGLDSRNVSIEVQEDYLTLSGEQQSVLCFHEEENAAQHMAGIPRFGKFSFSFQLPASVDANQAQAKYQEGILCVRFLKAQSARPIRVRIQSDLQNVQPSETAQMPAATLESGLEPSTTVNTAAESHKGRKKIS